MDNYKEVAEENLVEMKTKEEKTNQKMILAIIVFVIVILLMFAFFAGINIGEDLGIFFYNISH